MRFCEALGKHIIDCFAQDSFIKALNKADENPKGITFVLTALRQRFEKQLNHSQWQELLDVGTSVAGAVSRVYDCSKGLLVLLLACPEREGLSVKDLLPLLNYKGSWVLESSLKALMTENKYWSQSVNLANKFAGVAKANFPILKEHEDKMKALKSKEFEPELWLETISAALKATPELRTKLKPNATKRLESYVRAEVAPLVKYITSAESPQGLAVTSVQSLADGLTLFESDAAISDLLQKLQKWQASMASELIVQQFQEGMSAVMRYGRANWELLGELLPKLPELTEEMKTELREILHVFFLDFLEVEAAWP